MTNRVLLTGAGFSADFGAPLASEMSDFILNNLGKNENVKKLRNLIQKDFDYENIYQNVMHSNEYSEDEKRALNAAMKSAYKVVDEKIRTAGGLTQTYRALFNDLLFRFARTSNRRNSGFIFTLNQDLLVERRFDYYLNSDGISCLELPAMSSSVFKLHSEPLSDSNIRKIPNDFEEKKKQYENERQKNRVPLSYVKLHGSQEWITQDDNPIMVIGHGKIDRINADPILKWYFELFIEQLKVPGTKLLIIGYGFNDKHVNEAMANTKNLKIYIINPTPRRDMLNGNPHADQIKQLISGYFQTTLLKLFPNDCSTPESADWLEIKKLFF